MNDDSLRRDSLDAEQLDALITAAQRGTSVPDLNEWVEWGQMTKPDPQFVTDLEAHLLDLHRQKRRPPLKALRRVALIAAAVGVVVFAALLLVNQDQAGREKPSGDTALIEQTNVALAMQPTATQRATLAALPIMGTATLPPSSPVPVVPTVLAPTPTLPGTLALTATPLPEVVDMTALAGPTLAPTLAVGMTSTPPPTPSSQSQIMPVILTPTSESIHVATAVMVPPTPTPLAAPTSYQSTLKAGEIDDNQDFAAYLQYRLDYLRFMGGSAVHDVDVSERHIFRVTTAGGRPVLGAEVSIYDPHEKLIARLHTTAAGLAYFFPLAYPESASVTSFLVVVSKEGDSASFELPRGQRDAVWEVTLDVSPTQPPVALDVLFLLDSTGSMADEIAELKNNILSISAQVDALPGQPDVRYGLVTYRDRGDTYVTGVYDFTGDIDFFQINLDHVQADGGGDDPESLNEALHEALSGLTWRGPDAVRLIFLIADAPPHLDYAQDYDYAQEMRRAAESGIKIHAVASSGLDDAGEYIFRQLAQFTGGRFIFLLYDSSPQAATSSEPGAPGTEHHVPDEQYSVQYLDALIVNLITDELNALQGQ